MCSLIKLLKLYTSVQRNGMVFQQIIMGIDILWFGDFLNTKMLKRAFMEVQEARKNNLIKITKFKQLWQRLTQKLLDLMPLGWKMNMMNLKLCKKVNYKLGENKQLTKLLSQLSKQLQKFKEQKISKRMPDILRLTQNTLMSKAAIQLK